MAATLPQIELHTLDSADGSVTYTSPTSSHTLIAGVNYPLEVTFRSKEIPEDTYIEVNLRPHNAVAQVKERHVEELVRRVLKSVVRGIETPRCMLQCTIQVLDVEIDESMPGGVKGGGQGESYLEVLAGALNAAVLGCLDAGVQMWGVAGAVVVAITRKGELVVWPGLKQRKYARSLHVFAFDREGKVLLAESEGSFELEEWMKAQNTARKVVVGATTTDEVDNSDDADVAMGEDIISGSYFDKVRRVVEERVMKDSKLRGG